MKLSVQAYRERTFTKEGYAALLQRLINTRELVDRLEETEYPFMNPMLGFPHYELKSKAHALGQIEELSQILSVELTEEEE